MTAQELCAVFGSNVKRRRTAKGWTLREFAGKIGVDKSQLVKWEKGRALASGKNLALLSQLFGAEVWRLFYPDEAGAKEEAE